MTATRRRIGLTAVVVLTVSLAGCEPERSRWDVSLQPDGSGQVRLVHETAGDAETPPDEPAPAEGDEAAAELARLQAARFLGTVEGVAAWTDIAATPLPGGRTRVEATGWFRSLADVKVLGEPRFAVRVVGPALEVEYRDPIPRGLAELFLAERAKVQEAFDEPDERFAASVHRTRGFVEMSLAGWRFDLRLRLPGAITDAEGFARPSDERTVTLAQDVETVLALLDADLQALREVRDDVRQGRLSVDQGYARLAERLHPAPPHRVRAEVLDGAADAGFAAALEEATAAWAASEWRPLVEQLTQPK